MACEHMKQADPNVKARTPEGCEECMQKGMHWVQLRMCLVCGHVGCCDSSVGRHATQHFKDTGHPVMTEHPGRRWSWCYVHSDYV